MIIIMTDNINDDDDYHKDLIDDDDDGDNIGLVDTHMIIWVWAKPKRIEPLEKVMKA